jgi:alpha-glucosidase
VLNAYRTFVRWRRTQDALLFGDIRFLDSPDDTIAFVREYDGARLLAVFNFSRSRARYSLPMLAQAIALAGHGFAPCRVEAGRLELPGYGSYFARVP